MPKDRITVRVGVPQQMAHWWTPEDVERKVKDILEQEFERPVEVTATLREIDTGDLAATQKSEQP